RRNATGGRRWATWRGGKRHGPALASYLAERREGRPVVTDLGRAGPCVHRPHKKTPPRGRFPTGSRYPRAPAHAEVPFVIHHRTPRERQRQKNNNRETKAAMNRRTPKSEPPPAR